MTNEKARVQLIILGNGFDLNAGLNSRYQDFFDWKFDSSRPYAEEIKRIESGWSKKPNLVEVTVWDILFLQEGTKTDYLWVDVEKSIRDHLLAILQLNHNISEILSVNGGYIDDSNKPYIGIANIIKGRYGDAVTRMTGASNLNERLDVLNEILLNELHLFENSYAKYLKTDIQEKKQYPASARQRLKTIIKADTGAFRANVLSFNYTEPIKSASALEKLSIIEYRHVHGTLSGNEIVFGIDGHRNENVGVSSLLEFTKTFRMLNTKRKPSVSGAILGNTFLGNDIRAIKVFGHSLGDADYSYFQAIFDRVELYSGSTTLIFYLRSKRETENKTEYKTHTDRYYKNVARLLSEYGATLGNEDHGKNLMHKLILEDRLFFRTL